MHLLFGHFQVGRLNLRLQEAFFRALSKGLNHWRMGYVFLIHVAVSRRHHLHLVKVGAPFVWHGAWVVQVGLVHFFDIGRIAPEQIRVLLK